MLEHEEQALAQLSVDTPWRLVEAFSRQRRESPDEVDAGADILIDHLERAGLRPQVEAPPIFLGLPKSASIVLNGAALPAKAVSFCANRPKGVTAPLISLATTTAPGNPYSGANGIRFPGDIAGLFAGQIASAAHGRSLCADRIVVLDGLVDPEKVRRLEAFGAAGVVFVNPGHLIHWSSATTHWGSPGLLAYRDRPDVLALATNAETGAALHAAASRSEIATLFAETYEGWFPQKIVTVDIPGASDHFILLHGHYDVWDVGVGDNGTGNAVALEVARVLAKLPRLRRGVRICFWPGHSTGRYAGSTAHLDAHFRHYRDHCLAHVNCDSPGCRHADSYRSLGAMPETASLLQRTVRDLFQQEASIYRAPRYGDYSFTNLGISGLLCSSSMMTEETRRKLGIWDIPGCGGNVAWHTETDKLDIVDRDVLLADARFYLLTVLRLANETGLPLDWQAAVAAMRVSLGRYQTAASDLFEFSAAAAALDRLAEAIGASGGSRAGLDDARHLTLARHLVPLDGAMAGRAYQDPAAPMPSLPALSTALAAPEAGAPERHAIAADLQRGTNHLLDVVDRCIAALAT